MSISYIDVHGSPQNRYSLEVGIKGNLVSIPAGFVTLARLEYSLEDTTEYLYTSKEVRSVLEGHLVLTEDDKLAVFVDEIVDDGVDVPYTWKSSTLTYCAPLFRLDVPGGTENLEDLDLLLWRIL